MRDDTRPAHCTFSLLLLYCTIWCVDVLVCVWVVVSLFGKDRKDGFVYSGWMVASEAWDGAGGCLCILCAAHVWIFSV